MTLQNSLHQLWLSKTRVISTSSCTTLFLVTIFREPGPGQVHISIAYGGIERERHEIEEEKFHTLAVKNTIACFIKQITYICIHTHTHIFAFMFCLKHLRIIVICKENQKAMNGQNYMCCGVEFVKSLFTICNRNFFSLERQKKNKINIFIQKYLLFQTIKQKRPILYY